ncbi:type 4a pilus biogenesis protein PilO [Paraburkholderia azotifigens]|uniref:Pilus assembly protein n=1 Tax=Paraburkholderia azotifigens TaxID=2057004 RepID=A0ABU9RBR3_9BURK
MNMTIAGRFGRPAARERAGQALVERLRVPLEAWSVRRRWLVALCVAVAAFALGANAWLAADMSGVQASREALSVAQRKLSEAGAAVAQLPALRKAASVTRMPANWTSADDIRVISQLASLHELTLLSIEPGAVAGSGLDTMRPLRVTARADFDHTADFFEALASLPVLVVPDEVTLRRQGESLSVSATLHSFGAIHPVQDVARRSLRNDPDAFDPDEEIVFYDPFQPASIASASEDGSSPMRLVGLLADRMRGLALIETGEGGTTLETGQEWGGERVANVDARALTLAKRDGSAHSLTLAEEVE